MSIQQFSIYQLRADTALRPLRFRTYDKLRKSGYDVKYENYESVYIGGMLPEDTLEDIRSRFKMNPPKNFKGHSLGTSDVLVLNREGVISSFYVDKDGFIALAGFIRNASSGALISYETTNYSIEGKEGSWLAVESIIVDGKEFFLMEHEIYGTDAAWIVLDAQGKIVADGVYSGFDKAVVQQIKEYLHPSQALQSPDVHGKPPRENWQKYMENGEYLRSAEITEEQNYNMIDGRINNQNTQKDGQHPSVLAKLHQKQREIAARSGKPMPQMNVDIENERNRK